MSTFEIPPGVQAEVTLAECGNCHSPTPQPELEEGLCGDCRAAAARALALTIPPEQLAEVFTLPLDQAAPEDELEARRQRRKDVAAAADPEPRGWLQHATEAVRAECVRGKRGHEFTVDTIMEALDQARAPAPPEGAASLRFVMEQACQRGWCEQTGRAQPSRLPEMRGRTVRIYGSLL